MRLQRYINEGRSISISLEQAMETIRENCKDFLKKGSILYRGVYDRDQIALSVSPSDFKRKSRNTDNYYTLLIDNHPDWKSYPKRSKSIICTTDLKYATNMGTPYRVFPFDGSKLGICPKADMWESFDLDVESLQYLMDDINSMIHNFTKYDESDIETYTDLLQLFNKFDEYKSEFNIDRYMFDTFFDFKLFEPYFETDVNFIDFILEILDPKRHKFQLQTTKTFSSPKNREVWTDGTSILLNSKIADDAMKSF